MPPSFGPAVLDFRICRRKRKGLGSCGRRVVRKEWRGQRSEIHSCTRAPRSFRYPPRSRRADGYPPAAAGRLEKVRHAVVDLRKLLVPENVVAAPSVGVEKQRELALRKDVDFFRIGKPFVRLSAASAIRGPQPLRACADLADLGWKKDKKAPGLLPKSFGLGLSGRPGRAGDRPHAQPFCRSLADCRHMVTPTRILASCCSPLSILKTKKGYHVAKRTTSRDRQG